MSLKEYKLHIKKKLQEKRWITERVVHMMFLCIIYINHSFDYYGSKLFDAIC